MPRQKIRSYRKSLRWRRYTARRGGGSIAIDRVPRVVNDRILGMEKYKGYSRLLKSIKRGASRSYIR